MHIHFLGICGTFMGSLALLARDLGHTVTGSDQNIYPPMSTQLHNAGIDIMHGYAASHLQPAPDLVVVGNVMKRGIEAVEYMLNHRLAYTSAPQFLHEHLLYRRHVLAVAGTHGKTTTTTMLAWILHYAGIDTGFLIGGVPLVGGGAGADKARLQAIFARSSHLGADHTDGERYFVIEADEYDSAFFDKRSKFVHYRPTTVILNNLEYDHADIFDNLAAIQTQFHHLIRMVPATGQLIMPKDCPALEQTLHKGVWTPIWRTAIAGDSHADNDNHTDSDTHNETCADWVAWLEKTDGSTFHVKHEDEQGTVRWQMSGKHNVHNALVALAAAYRVGVDIATACSALSDFSGIKRRMELVGVVNQIAVYDDFAHHPTAIATTLDGIRKKLGQQKIWAVIEPRSNTMKLGVYQNQLAVSAKIADEVIWYQPSTLDWSVADAIGDTAHQCVMYDTDQIIAHLCTHANAGDVVVIMSNGGFENIHQRLLHALQAKLKLAPANNKTPSPH